MKFLLLLLLSSTHNTLCGQNLSFQKKIIQKAKEIDANQKEVISFSTSPDSRFFYKILKGKFVKLIHRFEKDNFLAEQIFYISNGELFYSIEKEALFFNQDSSIWKGTYFFKNGTLKDYETLGHGKSELDDWKPEKEVVRNYKRTKNVIVAYIKQKGEPR